MDDKLQAVQTGVQAVPQQGQFTQTGNDNMMVPNYGTVNITVQQMPQMMPYQMPTMPGCFYVPLSINREYYNLFVLGIEEFDKPYIKVPRDRALNQYMTKETMAAFDALTPEMIARIKTMPSLFMAENRQYGHPDDDQKVIYGFVSDIKIYDNDVKIYYCGYKNDILQSIINELQDELGIIGNRSYSELNRTHWSIKRADLIQELYEAQVQVPVFNMQSTT
ncbi:hypothetical protein [Butyricicoccus porcorum]|uniref:hypothetical protein n=1 Tax=Butyricicoccus porcorum TaxID=1945634 RepID=UPI003F4AAB36